MILCVYIYVCVYTFIYSDVSIHVITVGSRKLEYGYAMICAGWPSSLDFGVAGQSYSNFLGSAACHISMHKSIQIQTWIS